MRLGIMQPYFAPYLGYFDLIHRSDRWIVFDSVQYIRHGWVNRNRILHPMKGWQYVVVPLKKHRRETPIRDIQLAKAEDWPEKIRGQMQHYRRRAPHFTAVVDLLQGVFSRPHPSLVHLNLALLSAVCAHLGIPFRYEIFSEMNLALPAIDAPGEWALEIAAALGATSYINPPSGRDLFDPAAFRARGVELIIQENRPFLYETPGYEFVSDLSIIDVMLWNSPEKIRRHLESAPIR